MTYLRLFIISLSFLVATSPLSSASDLSGTFKSKGSLLPTGTKSILYSTREALVAPPYALDFNTAFYQSLGLTTDLPGDDLFASLMFPDSTYLTELALLTESEMRQTQGSMAFLASVATLYIASLVLHPKLLGRWIFTNPGKKIDKPLVYGRGDVKAFSPQARRLVESVEAMETGPNSVRRAAYRLFHIGEKLEEAQREQKRYLRNIGQHRSLVDVDGVSTEMSFKDIVQKVDEDSAFRAKYFEVETHYQGERQYFKRAIKRTLTLPFEVLAFPVTLYRKDKLLSHRASMNPFESHVGAQSRFKWGWQATFGNVTGAGSLAKSTSDRYGLYMATLKRSRYKQSWAQYADDDITLLKDYIKKQGEIEAIAGKPDDSHFEALQGVIDGVAEGKTAGLHQLATRHRYKVLGHADNRADIPYYPKQETDKLIMPRGGVTTASGGASSPPGSPVPPPFPSAGPHHPGAGPPPPDPFPPVPPGPRKGKKRQTFALGSGPYPTFPTGPGGGTPIGGASPAGGGFVPLISSVPGSLGVSGKRARTSYFSTPWGTSHSTGLGGRGSASGNPLGGPASGGYTGTGGVVHSSAKGGKADPFASGGTSDPAGLAAILAVMGAQGGDKGQQFHRRARTPRSRTGVVGGGTRPQ